MKEKNLLRLLTVTVLALAITMSTILNASATESGMDDIYGKLSTLGSNGIDSLKGKDYVIIDPNKYDTSNLQDEGSINITGLQPDKYIDEIYYIDENETLHICDYYIEDDNKSVEIFTDTTTLYNIVLVYKTPIVVPDFDYAIFDTLHWGEVYEGYYSPYNVESEKTLQYLTDIKEKTTIQISSGSKIWNNSLNYIRLVVISQEYADYLKDNSVAINNSTSLNPDDYDQTKFIELHFTIKPGEMVTLQQIYKDLDADETEVAQPDMGFGFMSLVQPNGLSILSKCKWNIRYRSKAAITIDPYLCDTEQQSFNNETDTEAQKGKKIKTVKNIDKIKTADTMPIGMIATVSILAAGAFVILRKKNY